MSSPSCCRLLLGFNHGSPPYPYQEDLGVEAWPEMPEIPTGLGRIGPIPASAIKGGLSLLNFSAVILQLVLEGVLPEVDDRKPSPSELVEKEEAWPPGEPRRLAGGEPPELVELRGEEEPEL